MVFAFFANTFSQKPVIELTFTADNNGQYVSLDSILIRNLTQGGDTMLYAPDTILVLEYISGIGDNYGIEENTFTVSQNYPNPSVNGQTSVNLYLYEKEYIEISILDLLGRKVAHYENTLNSGNHSFTFYPGKEKYYLFAVTGNQVTKTIKMVNINSNSETQNKIVYNGYEKNVISFKSQQEINNFIFTLGDKLRYIGYAKTVDTINGSDVIEDTPQSNETYLFEISEGIPCSGISIVTYEGQSYNTVLIGNQCWLKENLNVGIMINGMQNQTNNGLIEKYCWSNDPSNCETYGGFYQWNEMMQYVTIQVTQGICPQGWRLPTDADWCILEQEVDPTITCSSTSWRGIDGGTKLKQGGSSGFSALMAGNRQTDGSFYNSGPSVYFWTSTDVDSNAWYRTLNFGLATVSRFNNNKPFGFSVRCLKD